MSNSESLFPALSRIPRGIWAALRWTARWTWKPILVLAIILALAHSIAGFILGRRLEAEIRAIKARGEPVSMVELGLPKVADAENAAIPYAKVFEELTGMVLNPKGGPPLKSPTGNDEYNQVIDRFLTPEERAKDPQIWDKARRVVQKHQKVIPLIEEAVSRPHCQFPVNWKDGPGAIFPHFMPMREMSRFLRANALLAARDGDMEQAVRYVRLGFGTSELLKDEPTLIGQLVRMAMVKITSKSLQEILTYGEIDASSARELADLLAGMDMRPGLYKAMLGERAGGLACFELVDRSPAGISMLMNLSASPEPSGGGRLFAQLLSPELRPLWYADRLVYLRRMDEQIRITRRPWREAKALQARLDSETIPRYAILSSIVLPVFSRSQAKRDEIQAEVGACRIILGLQVYKQRYETYPQALDGLRSLGWDVPEDPFSGNDFVYKRQNGEYILYSIGQDLKDDGARTFAQEVEVPPTSPPGAAVPGQPMAPPTAGPARAPQIVAPSGPGGLPAPAAAWERHEYKAPDGRWADDIIWESER